MTFIPRQFVTVTLFGLNYKGRVIRCILEHGGGWLFDVQYADDRGELRRGEFTACELEPQP